MYKKNRRNRDKSEELEVKVDKPGLGFTDKDFSMDPSPKNVDEGTKEEVREDIEEVKEEKVDTTIEFTDPKPVSSPEPQVVKQPKGNNMSSELEAKLILYVDKMSDKKVIGTDEVGSVQYGFYSLLRSILKNQDPSVAYNNWNTLLNFANKNKDKVFNEMNLFIGAPHWKGSDKEFTSFRRLGWVILKTMKPKTRRSNLTEFLNDNTVSFLSELERNNLFNFYS